MLLPQSDEVKHERNGEAGGDIGKEGKACARFAIFAEKFRKDDGIAAGFSKRYIDPVPGESCFPVRSTVLPADEVTGSARTECLLLWLEQADAAIRLPKRGFGRFYDGGADSVVFSANR